MMTFSIDTNIVIGILNPKDKLHHRSISLVRVKSKKEKLILFISVLTESNKAFIKKYNKATSEIFRIVSELNRKGLDRLDFDKAFTKKISNLIQRRRDINGFIKLIYGQLKPFIDRQDMQGGFGFISRKGTAHLAWTGTIIRMEAQDNFGYWNLEEDDFQHLGRISKVVDSVPFKDSYDKDIFVNAVAFSFSEKVGLTLYTNDNEFIESAEDALIRVNEDSTYKDNDFSVEKLP